MTYRIQRPLGRLCAFAFAIVASASFAGTSTEVEGQSTIAATTTGSGTYVCTPAGFGSKSRCYLR